MEELGGEKCVCDLNIEGVSLDSAEYYNASKLDVVGNPAHNESWAPRTTKPLCNETSQGNKSSE